MEQMQDKFRRVVNYMRISVIDRCNLRCIYCMPAEGIKPIAHKSILRYEEITRIVKIAAATGVRQIRLTGGEPLIRKDLAYLVSSLSAIEGIEDISLTTNGLLLKKHARPLADAGLRRVNVSLDSLSPDKYRDITRGGDIDTVLEGIREAEDAGLLPVKINMVPIRGFNDSEIEAFARLTMKASYHVRYIEFMPIGAKELWSAEKYISTDEVKAKVSAIAPLIPAEVKKSGPARYFRFENAPGAIGFISPVTNHFCGRCNRLRLTSDGKLRPCLFSETEVDLKSAMRRGDPDSEIERLLRLAIEVKPRGHSLETGMNPPDLKPMSRIGG